MSRLIGFGCSISITHGWVESSAEELGITPINLSLASGSNQVQAKRFQEIVLDNNIQQDDIIVWQLTTFIRRFLRLKFDERNKKILKHDRKLNKWPSYEIGIHSNIFDNMSRVDVLSHSSLLQYKNVFALSLNDEEQILEDILFTLISAKFFAPNILVFRGWDDVMESVYWSKFKQELHKRNINTSDVSLVEWCRENNLSFKEDGSHPSEEASKLFGKLVITPMIKKILMENTK